MTSSVDRTIAALRSTHDDLAGLVAGLGDDQLAVRSGAAEWSVAQALSHLGSGAEIGLATVRAAVAGEPAPGQDFNQTVWDRWNALGAHDQATGFLAHDGALVAAVEALGADQRETLQVDLGLLPAPLPLGAYLGMRLNEAAQHSWDVRVPFDPQAGIDADTALVLAEHFAADLSFLLGFTGKADQVTTPVVLDIAETGFAVVIADAVSLTAANGTTTPPATASPATATFAGPLEAAVRLLAGRLGAQYTPAEVRVSGNVTLDELRRVFPGY